MRNEETVEAIGGLAEQPGSSEAIDRRRPDSLLRMQNAALELLSGGGSLTAVLDLIARGFEAIEPGIHCTILLCDDGRLHGGVAPSLPAEYNAAVEGLAIGHGVGSCGHAAHTGRPMVVRDIASHPYWEAGRALALKHGLRACWSTPILSRDHEVLGVFAVYHEVPYEPRGSDFELVEAATHIAGIAIERKPERPGAAEQQPRARRGGPAQGCVPGHARARAAQPAGAAAYGAAPAVDALARCRDRRAGARDHRAADLAARPPRRRLCSMCRASPAAPSRCGASG